jgi:transcriptional regulator with XRE-family HTH domain
MDARRLLAWNLRRHRVQRGLSQEKLAVDAQIDRTYVSSLQRGLENPTVSVLDKLAGALSIPIADFSEYHRAGSGLRNRYRPDVAQSRTKSMRREY